MNIIIRHTQNLGDRAVEASTAVEATPETTLRELLEKVFVDGVKARGGLLIADPNFDYIELRFTLKVNE